MSVAPVYTQSGKMGNGPWSIPIVAVPVTLMASMIYAYISVYSPVKGYLSVLFTIGYGGLIAYVIGRAGKAAKCRSHLCLQLMGLLCGLLAIYAGWVVFLYALINRYSSAAANVSLFGLFMSPGAIWNMMVGLNATGWYSIKGSTPTGIFLWICWGMEALIILGITVFCPSQMLNAWVFCEPCDKWCAEKDGLARFGAVRPGDQTSRLKRGDLTVLAELPTYSGGKTEHIRLNNRRCDACGQTETVLIERVWYDAAANEQKEKTEAMTKHILLDADALNALQTALAAQAAAIPTPKIPANP